MSYTAQETKEMRCSIALELARFKMQCRVAQGHIAMLSDEDLNEIFVVAGLELLTPGELDREVDLINISREDKKS